MPTKKNEEEKVEIPENQPGAQPLTEVYEDLYREGDVVPETGHYMCIFDNYIESFSEGEEFTTCPSGHGMEDVCWKNID